MPIGGIASRGANSRSVIRRNLPDRSSSSLLGRPTNLILPLITRVFSRSDRLDCPHLHRGNFTQRIRLEEKLRRAFVHLCFFTFLLVAYVTTILYFDDVKLVGQIHNSLRAFYGFNGTKGYQSPFELMDYIQTFIFKSYSMASALVDANTLDSIDVVRCLSEEISDVCRLKYWSTPTQNRSAPNYLDLDALFGDTLSPLNTNASVIDCGRPNQLSNCIDRSDGKFVNKTLSRPTFGLLPEEPIILDRRLRFPLASVVVLTPLVWQTRSPRVPCEDIGKRYATEVMRPAQGSHTSFESSRRSPNTGRIQNIFLSYAEDSLICVDRSKLVDSTFFDRSWHPWATYDAMRVGLPTRSVSLAGKPIYYKFVPDVAYLQAPILGVVRLTSNPCADGDACKGARQDNVSCVDPLQVGPSHPMWQDSPDLTYRNCSARKLWDSIYLNAPRESWSDQRENTFFTIETSEINVASLILTPQMDNISDVVTLAWVTFVVEQSGYIHANASLASSIDKPWTWYLASAFVIFAAISYLVFTWEWISLRDELSPGRRQKALDTVICIAVSVHIICSLAIELETARIPDTILTAFRTNSEAEHFSTISKISVYNGRLRAVRTYGFLVMVLLFIRVCLFCALHPRLALMVDTLRRSSDDLLHFVIYIVCMEVFFACFAHWAFGQKASAYFSMTNVFWTQFRVAVGDFSFSTEVAYDPLFTLYVVTYVFVIYILMLNLLMAIIVEGYMSVKDTLYEAKSENSFPADVADVFRMWVVCRLRRFPSSAEVWRYLSTRGQGTSAEVSSLPAVTAEELLGNVTKLNGSVAFESLVAARAYCKLYGSKVREAGVYTMRESRREQLLSPGKFFNVNVESHRSQNEEDREIDLAFPVPSARPADLRASDPSREEDSAMIHLDNLGQCDGVVSLESRNVVDDTNSSGSVFPI